jgi:HD-like signal output (HDOD) protein
MGLPTLQDQSRKLASGSAPIELVERRRNRILGILAEGLPSLPNHIMQLNGLLASSPIDLRRISKVIRSDLSLTAQVIRLCNSALFGIRRRIFKVEEAAVLMGADRLRTLIFTCYLMECSGKWLHEREVQDHWRHCFITALLSERIARSIGYQMPDQAYLAGLLHDVGKLPLLMVSAEEGSMASREVLLLRGDSRAAEREYFGLDHCEVGRWVGSSWNFYPCHIDVFEYHHSPAQAKHDPLLVGIVSVADHYCEEKESEQRSPGTETKEIMSEAGPENEPHAAPISGATFHNDGPNAVERDAKSETMGAYIRECMPSLDTSEWHRVMRVLENEYINVLPIVEQSYGAVTGNSAAAAPGLGPEEPTRTGD